MTSQNRQKVKLLFMAALLYSLLSNFDDVRKGFAAGWNAVSEKPPAKGVQPFNSHHIR